MRGKIGDCAGRGECKKLQPKCRQKMGCAAILFGSDAKTKKSGCKCEVAIFASVFAKETIINSGNN